MGAKRSISGVPRCTAFSNRQKKQPSTPKPGRSTSRIAHLITITRHEWRGHLGVAPSFGPAWPPGRVSDVPPLREVQCDLGVDRRLRNSVVIEVDLDRVAEHAIREVSRNATFELVARPVFHEDHDGLARS